MSSPDTYAQGSPSDLSRALRRRWWLVVLIALIGAGLGVGGSLVLPQRYSATVTIVVQLPSSSADTEALVRTVEALATSSVVLRDVSSNSGANLSPAAISNLISVNRPSGSSVVEVSVTDPKRSLARDIANQIVPSLQQRILESRSSTEPSSARIAIESFGGGPVVERVQPPVVRNGAVGLVAGAALGLLVAVASAGRAARRRSR